MLSAVSYRDFESHIPLCSWKTCVHFVSQEICALEFEILVFFLGGGERVHGYPDLSDRRLDALGRAHAHGRQILTFW